MDKLDLFIRNHHQEVTDMRMCFTPQVSALLYGPLKEDCPDTARTCDHRKYPDCCVPSLGKLVFSQFWDKNEPIEAFTIHGLWPSFCATGYYPPAGCREPTSQYDVKAAVDLDPKFSEVMNYYWPDKQGTLWANEWNKHGSCLSTIESNCYGNDFHWNEIIRYFTVTLSVYAQFDIMAALKDTNIRPGNYYTKSKFFRELPMWREGLSLYCTDGELTEVRFSLHGYPKHQHSIRNKASDGTCQGSFYFPPKVGRAPQPVPAPAPPNMDFGALDVQAGQRF